MKKYQITIEKENEQFEKVYSIAQNKREAIKITKAAHKGPHKGQEIKIVSCYEMVSVQIEDIAKTDFSRACLSELKAEGVKVGDIIHGALNRKNWAVDFVSKETGTDCMAWLGTTCRLLFYLEK